MSAHYYLEDQKGIRLADFHNGPRQDLRLLLPKSVGTIYVKKPNHSKEYVISAWQQDVDLADLAQVPSQSQIRGAAQDSFALLFSEPFGIEVVSRFEFSTLEDLGLALGFESDNPNLLHPLAWASLGTGVACLLSGVLFSRSAVTLKNKSSAYLYHADVTRLNHSIQERDKAAFVLYASAGASLVAGLLLLLWPDSSTPAQLRSKNSGLEFEVRF